jgi:L-lactate dehydrogenase
MIEAATDAAPKVAIVGAGNVGATYAYALLLSGLVPDVVLINRDRQKAQAEADDLNHAGPFAPSGRARAGDYADTKGAFLTVLAAGAAQGDEDSRQDLAEQNARIFREIVPSVVAANPGGLLLVATNPVDVLTRLTLDLSGLPSGRVLGSGTILDSARLTFLLAERFGVDERTVEATVLGEHGESAVPLWSSCRISGVPVAEFARLNAMPFDEIELSQMFETVTKAADVVAAGKGATFYAVASALMRITEAILRDASVSLPISTRPDDDAALHYGTRAACLSLPCVVNRQGIRRVLKVPLSASEKKGLQASARVLEATWKEARKAESDSQSEAKKQGRSAKASSKIQ